MLIPYSAVPERYRTPGAGSAIDTHYQTGPNVPAGLASRDPALFASLTALAESRRRDITGVIADGLNTLLPAGDDTGALDIPRATTRAAVDDGPWAVTLSSRLAAGIRAKVAAESGDLSGPVVARLLRDLVADPDAFLGPFTP
jgi:hypothetical protein